MTVIVTNSDNSKCRINQHRYRDVQKSGAYWAANICDGF